MAVVLLRAGHDGFRKKLAPFLVSAGILELGTGLAYVPGADALFWQHLSVGGAGGLSTSLIWLGLSITGGGRRSASQFRDRAVWALSTAFAAAGLLGLFFEPRAEALILTEVGRIAYVVLMICLVLALAQVEAIVRATASPLRYGIEFVLLGVGAIAAFCIYASSRVLLFGRWPATDPLAGAIATLVSLTVVGFGLLRSRFRDATERVAVSPQMVYGSLTVFVVGLYLLAAGVAGYLIRLSGSAFSGALSQIVVFVAALALALAASSRATRLEVRRLVARHFLRSRHDYRTEWLEVTEVFEASASEESILDGLLHLLSRTFGAGRILGVASLRRRPAVSRGPFAQHGRAFEASACVAPGHRPPCHIRRTALHRIPVSGGRGIPPGHAGSTLRSVRTGRELIAFIALSAAPRGESYGEDDRDLLRAIARHVAVLLAHARLAEERRAAAELEALHRFSAFCMHDLKNLAARLSLGQPERGRPRRRPGLPRGRKPDHGTYLRARCRPSSPSCRFARPRWGTSRACRWTRSGRCPGVDRSEPSPPR